MMMMMFEKVAVVLLLVVGLSKDLAQVAVDVVLFAMVIVQILLQLDVAMMPVLRRAGSHDLKQCP